MQCHKQISKMDRGGGQVISVLAFYSNDPSSNPAEAYNFSIKFVFEKNKKTKEAGVGPFYVSRKKLSRPNGPF